MSYAKRKSLQAKAAHAEYKRKHYIKNKKQYIAKAAIYKKAVRNYVIEIKNVPCKDCKKRYPFYVMEFDHIDKTTKIANIAALIKEGSLRKLKIEIAKCEVVCSNCHRVRTYAKYSCP